MSTSFAHIAYQVLDVCNGVEMARVEALVERTGLLPGAMAVDVGTGNGAVAIRLAKRFGFRVTAIELNSRLVDLAEERVGAASAGVTVVHGQAHELLIGLAPVDLITALGTTNVNGEGRPTPEAGFRFLRDRLRTGGWLLWGDLTWRSEPSAPLRQVAEATNQFADAAGWTAAAEAAGFEVAWTEQTPQDVFDAYAAASVGAARDWLVANPEAAEAAAVRFHADRMQAIFDFGRGVLGFGLYLLRAPD